jgi:hypothetical protein
MRNFRLVHFLRFSPIYILILVLFLNLSGFCWQKFRYLSHHDKIEASFLIINRLTETRIGNDYFERLPYSSLKEFLNVNPNCCITNYQGTGEIPLPNFFDNLTGNSLERIRLKYKDNYYDKKEILTSIDIESVIGLRSCGKLYIY